MTEPQTRSADRRYRFVAVRSQGGTEGAIHLAHAEGAPTFCRARYRFPANEWRESEHFTTFLRLREFSDPELFRHVARRERYCRRCAQAAIVYIASTEFEA